MKAFLYLLLILSIACNVSFLAGCAAFHDVVYGKPCKFAPKDDGGKDRLVRIANILDIRTDGKTVSDLESDIKYKLDRSTDIPKAMEGAAVEKLSVRLIGNEKTEINRYHQFISDLQGKRVIVIERED